MAYKGISMQPKDFDDWYDLVRALVQMATDSYGREEVKKWSFEGTRAHVLSAALTRVRVRVSVVVHWHSVTMSVRVALMHPSSDIDTWGSSCYTSSLVSGYTMHGIRHSALPTILRVPGYLPVYMCYHAQSVT
jgi:hypothetical protein